MKLPKVSFKISPRFVFYTFVIVLVAFSVGYALGLKNFSVQLQASPKVTINRELPEGKELDFSLFWRVWDTLETRYYDKTKLNKADMIYGAIQGMVAAIGDPYTAFLPPDDNKIVQEDLHGSFGGVGIHIGFQGTQLAVVTPLVGSPAEQAGILPGDLIVGITDETKAIDTGTFGMSLPEAVNIIRGPAGSVVTLTLLRQGSDEPLIVDVTRAEIEVPSVSLEFPAENIAHLKITKFAEETVTEWDEKVTEILLNPGIDSIILDVRNNSGGYLQAAVDIASDFIDTGDTVVIQEDGTGARNEIKSEKISRLIRYNTLVLVNKGSASASEILAGALRDINKTTLVGEITFGKGTIQDPIQVNGGSALHITTARWLTPKGTWVNDAGLKPDVEVENDTSTLEDEQLIRALEIISQ